MSALFEHDVVVVTIADAKDVGDDAVAGAGTGEVVNGAGKFQLGGIVFLQPIRNRGVLETARHATIASNLDLSGETEGYVKLTVQKGNLIFQVRCFIDVILSQRKLNSFPTCSQISHGLQNYM